MNHCKHDCKERTDCYFCGAKLCTPDDSPDKPPKLKDNKPAPKEGYKACYGTCGPTGMERLEGPCVYGKDK